MPPARTAVTSRGRRTPRPTGDERQSAILATAERLLSQRSFGEISIDDLARGAGISRPTFYFYFAAKDAVLLALLDRVVAQAGRAVADAHDAPGLDPVARWREGIGRSVEAFRAHWPVMLACAQVRFTNAEVRQLWNTVLDGWVRSTTAVIEAERRRGAAPDGAPARQLAIALHAMNERTIYATLTGDGPAIDAADVVDTLLGIWLTTIYGSHDAGSA